MYTDLPVAPNSNAGTLVITDLPPLGRTGPLPDGTWCINTVLGADNCSDRGLQLYIDPWAPMSQGDNLEILRDSDVVGTERIKEGQAGQQTSQEMKAYVKRDRLGGHDQNGDTPGHAELRMSILNEIVQGGTDKDTATAGAPVTIEPYSSIAENDVIHLSWDGQFVSHTVTQAQATPPASNPIEIVAKEDVILAAGDSGQARVAMTFEVFDLVLNRSKDWSAEICIVVDTSSSHAESDFQLRPSSAGCTGSPARQGLSMDSSTHYLLHTARHPGRQGDLS